MASPFVSRAVTRISDWLNNICGTVELDGTAYQIIPGEETTYIDWIPDSRKQADRRRIGGTWYQLQMPATGWSDVAMWTQSLDPGMEEYIAEAEHWPLPDDVSTDRTAGARVNHATAR
jgi:hypothetical protein